LIESRSARLERLLFLGDLMALTSFDFISVLNIL